MNLFGIDLKKSKLDKRAKIVYVLITLYMASILAFSYQRSMIKYSQLIFVVAFGSCILYLVRRRVRFMIRPVILMLMMFTMFCTLSIAWSENVNLSSARVYTLAQLLIMAFCIYTFVIYTKNINAILVSIFLAGIIASIYILNRYGYQRYINLMLEGKRVGSDIANTNTVGIYMSIVALIGFYFGYYKHKIISYFLMVLPAIMALGSGSKKALILLVGGIALLLIMYQRTNMKSKNFTRFVVMTILLVGVFIWITTLPIFETVFLRFYRMFGIDGEEIDGSTIHRLDMIKVGWSYFITHIFTGAGPACARYILKDYYGISNYHYMHNNYIELLSTVGIIGTLLYYSSYFYILKKFLFLLRRKEVKPEINLLFVLLVLQMIIEVGMVSYYDKMTYIYISVMAAAIYLESQGGIPSNEPES